MDATQEQLAKENAILQARSHKLEANAQRSSLMECYKRCGKQLGDWNGAKPVIEHIDALEREIEQLRELVVNADAVSRARFEYYGLCDCIDNAGGPYPSQWAADLIERARTTTEPAESLQRWSG